MAPDDEPSAWEYELRFSQDNRQRPIIKKERVAKNGVELLQRPLDEDEQDPERLTQTYLEQVNVNQAFREVADFFASVRYLHIVPQLVREPDRSVASETIHSEAISWNSSRSTPEKTRSAWLRRIRDALP